MTGIDNIVVASDLSPRAERAVRRATQLAAQHGARLRAIHVLDEELPDARLFDLLKETPAQVGERMANEAGRVLQEQVESGAPGGGLNYAVETRVGKAYPDILDAAGDARLLVLGAHGKHFVRDLVVSTTADRLLRKGAVPVLVVKRTDGDPYREILVPVDFSTPSRLALEFAARIAPDATLHVLHAYDISYEERLRTAGVELALVDSYHAEKLDRVQQEMDSFLRGTALGQAKVAQHILPGYPPTVIGEAAVRLKADLIAMGKYGRGRVQELLLGSVTSRVVNETDRDVLIVPNQH